MGSPCYVTTTSRASAERTTAQPIGQPRLTLRDSAHGVSSNIRRRERAIEGIGFSPSPSIFSETPMRRFTWFAVVAVFAWLSTDFLYSTFLKYRGSDPRSFGLFLGRESWLYVHLTGGAITVVLGLFQLVRQKFVADRPVHRWTGRLYLLGMFVACAGAVGLITTSPAPNEIRIAFSATMIAWLTTAAVAVNAIRKRRFVIHRTWMFRHYLVTLAPITFRLLLPKALAMGISPSPTLIAALLWASWIAPLLIFEALWRMPGIRPIQRVPDYRDAVRVNPA